MTSIIDPNADKVMQIYNQYYDILTMRGSNETDMRAIAASLTQAHFMDHVVCVLKELVVACEPR